MANSIVVPDVAKIRLAQALILGGYSPIDGNSTAHLFSNTPTLGAATTLADFTEIVLDGYTPMLLSGATNNGIVSGDLDEWQWPTMVVEAASDPPVPVTAYGYWVTSNDDGALLWCQYFDVWFTWAAAGDGMGFALKLDAGEIAI